MRQSILILLGLIACNPKKESNRPIENAIKTSLVSTLKDKTISSFTDNEQATVVVDSNATQIKNVFYSEQYLNKDNEFANYIVKQVQEITTIRGQEGQHSKITLDIFNIADGKLVKTISKLTDELSIFSEYTHSIDYGCCGSENYNELSALWTGETFLKYNSKYYFIEIPNAHTSFYLGYLADTRNERDLIIGTLYLAHSLPALKPGKNTYSSSFKNVNKIVFKVKTKELFEKISPFTPTMTLVRHTSKDQLIEHSDHQELRLWTFDGFTDLKGINFIGLQIQFESDHMLPMEIPIKNGLLFGDNNYERTIYVNE